MASVTPNVNLYFNLDSKQVFVKDSTVWPVFLNSSLDVILDLKGLGTLYSPSNGVIFSVTNPSTPLIDIADGAETSSNYNLPLTGGAIINGTYTLNYEAQGSYTQTALPVEVISNLGYIEVDDDAFAAFILQVGDTVNITGSVIEGNDGAWTVSSVEANGSFSKIYLTRNGDWLIADNSGDAQLTYTIERTYATTLTPAYSGCTKITPAINFESLPYNGEFGTVIVLDTTVYGNTTVSDKVISVLYPDGLYPAPTFNPIIGEDVNSVTLSQVATGTYTITLTGLITVAPTVGLGYTYQMSGIRVNGRPVNVFEREVVWNGDLCCLQECITTVFDRHNRFVLQGQESPYTAAIADLSLAINRYIIALQCGIKTDIDSTYTDIKNILASTDCPCGCSDSTNPVWISNSSQEGENLITNLQDQIDVLDGAINGINASILDINAELETKLSEVFHTNQFSGSGTEADPLEIIDLDANLVSISPGIPGLDSQSLWLALSDLQLNKLETVRRNASQFSGNGTVLSPLQIINLDANLVSISPGIPGLDSQSLWLALSDLQLNKLETVARSSSQFSGNGTTLSPLQITDLDANLVSISPGIPGLDSQNLWLALSDLQLNKLEIVRRDASQFSGNGTLGSLLTIINVDADIVSINPISGLTATNTQTALAQLQANKITFVATNEDQFSGVGTSGSPLEIIDLLAEKVTISPAISGLNTNLQNALGELKTLATPTYTEYVARISQSGTSAPSATVIFNGLGATISFGYGATGDYFINASSPVFTADKTAIFITQGGGGTSFVSVDRNSASQLELYVKNNLGVDTNNGIINTYINIRVYA